MICETTASCIGNTPMIALDRLCRGLPGRILAKVEFLNPGGSVKDRVALAMLENAELPPGATVIEATSGNTGIALAMLCAARELRCIIVMPDTMPPERKSLIEAYGAEVVQTPGAMGMAGSVQKAQALALQIPGSFIPDQFRNAANPDVHYRHTGPEIWAAAGGSIDVFVAGVGTGGTFTGVGRYLQQKNPEIELYAVEPAASPLLSSGFSGIHGIHGIGPNFLPEVLDTGLIQHILPVTDGQATEAARSLARQEGLMAGISSGAAVYAALTLARREENAGRTIVTILPDTGHRYLSTGLFQDGESSSIARSFSSARFSIRET